MTHPPRNAATPWTREQIRGARAVALAPLLTRRGLRLRPVGGDNVEILEYPGLVLKASYWRWRAPAKLPGEAGPLRDMAGNTIDFYVKVLGTSFADAMKEILAQP